jgi:hypothetical protein
MNQTTRVNLFRIIVMWAFILTAALPVYAMRFSHILHEENGIAQCSKCHLPGAASIIPERSGCYDCHDAKSIEETVLGPVRTHTPLWVKTHGPESEVPDAQCTECHKLSFCVDCHKGGELGTDLKRRTARFDTAPSTHTARFRIVHPLKAIGENAQQCYTCHSKQECVDCHQSYLNRFPARDLVSHQTNWEVLISRNDVPDHEGFNLNQCQDCHPGGALSSSEWSDKHAREARRSLAGCQTCHPEGAACMPCHSARSGLMVSPHPRNWKRIQGKFRRESPEVCDKCH